MRTRLRLALALPWVLVVACSQPRVAGVLTLAPAAMMASAGCRAEEDGTLKMPAQASATTTAYAPTGTLEAAVVGQALGPATVELEVYFDGRLVARLSFGPSEGEVRREFQVPVDREGPHTWRVAVAGEGGGAEDLRFHFQRLVLRIA